LLEPFNLNDVGIAMLVAKTIRQIRDALRAGRARGEVIGFVPTMGAWHEGHVSLARAARGECDLVVVSIFVNPTQFGPGEDYQRYPRPIESDLQVCRSVGVDLVFNPSVEQMYPDDTLTTVRVSKLTETLCGPARPGHFEGVTTVVAKLFNIVQPNVAYFGQKDAQQALVIGKMIGDLDFPITLRVCPTVRAPDGLALSSRNEYLSDDDRKRALCLSKALNRAREMVRSGQIETKAIIDRMHEIIASARPARIDYISIVNPQTMAPVDRIDGPVMIAAAVVIRSVRLIDNIILDAGGDEIIIEGLFVNPKDVEQV